MRIASFAVLSLALSLPLAAGAQNFAGKPFLSVQGHAETRVKPDLFPLDVTLSDTSMDPARSQQLIEGLAKSVLDAAARQQLVDADIEVGNLSVSPQTKYDDDTDQETFLGNEYQRKFRLRFHTLEALRGFIDSTPVSKNLRLQTGKFEYSKEAELRRKLRRDAIADARRGAEDMAAAVGKKLLELQNVSDRAQSTVYSASGYNSAVYGYSAGGNSSLGTVTVNGANIIRGSTIVLREGEIEVSADAFLVYVIGD